MIGYKWNAADSDDLEWACEQPTDYQMAHGIAVKDIASRLCQMTEKESLALWYIYLGEAPREPRMPMGAACRGPLIGEEFECPEAAADEKSAARWRGVVREHLPRLRSEAIDA